MIKSNKHTNVVGFFLANEVFVNYVIFDTHIDKCIATSQLLILNGVELIFSYVQEGIRVLASVI